MSNASREYRDMEIVGARENNLRNVSLHNRFTLN